MVTVNELRKWLEPLPDKSEIFLTESGTWWEVNQYLTSSIVEEYKIHIGTRTSDNAGDDL